MANAAGKTRGKDSYLRFVVSGDEFAVALGSVEEIVQYAAPSPVPSAAPWIRGVFNLRGQVVPVADLATRIGLERGALTNRTVLLVLTVVRGGQSTRVALVSDLVRDVVEADPSQLEEPPAFGLGLNVEYIEGLIDHDGSFLKLLCIETVFGDGLQAAKVQPSIPLDVAAAQEQAATASPEAQSPEPAEQSQTPEDPGEAATEVFDGIFLFPDDDGNDDEGGIEAEADVAQEAA